MGKMGAGHSIDLTSLDLTSLMDRKITAIRALEHCRGGMRLWFEGAHAQLFREQSR